MPLNAKFTLSAMMTATTSVTMEYVMNCDVQSSQRNYLELTDCGDIFNSTITQANVAVIRQECAQVSTSDFVLANLDADLLKIASQAAEDLYSQWIEASGETVAGLQGKCDAKGVTCNYSSLLEACYSYTKAVSASMRSDCSVTSFQSNSIVCSGNGSTLNLVAIKQTNVLDSVKSCASSNAGVTSAAALVEDAVAMLNRASGGSQASSARTAERLNGLAGVGGVLAIVFSALAVLAVAVLAGVGGWRGRRAGRRGWLAVGLGAAGLLGAACLAWGQLAPALDLWPLAGPAPAGWIEPLLAGLGAGLVGLSLAFSVRAIRTTREK